VLSAIVEVFQYCGELKQIHFPRLYEEVQIECSERKIQKMEMMQFLNCVDELEYYNFVRIERNKRDAKASMLALKVELAELKVALTALKE